MTVPKDTLKAMIRDYHGFEMSDEELEIIGPDIANYLSEVEKLRELDLSDLMSSRLLRVDEGGGS